MSKDTLRIDLYGDVRIIFNDEDITQKFSKKSIGLIAYLLCTPSQQASKNTLKDLLWIDAGEKAAYNLRFNLWNIKKNIPEVGGENFIITSGNLCRINLPYKLRCHCCPLINIISRYPLINPGTGICQIGNPHFISGPLPPLIGNGTVHATFSPVWKHFCRQCI